MALNKFSTQLLVATLGCALPVLVGVISPAVAFDFQLSGTLGTPMLPPGVQFPYASFNGTISTPGNQPISTYDGPFSLPNPDPNSFGRRIPTFNINFYNAQGNLRGNIGGGLPLLSLKQEGSETLLPNGNRRISLSESYAAFSELDLTFSPDPASPAGLTFSSGSWSFNGFVVGLPYEYSSQLFSASVTSATITPVPAPAPIGGILFLPGLAYWLLRKKI